MKVFRPLAFAGALAAVAMTAIPAAADVTDKRQARQADRIEQGIRDGSLTRREADRLIHEQRKIADFERQAKRDGHIDYIERRHLQAAQDRASRHIRHEKHDFQGRLPNQRRYGRHWNGHRHVWGWYWGPRWY